MLSRGVALGLKLDMGLGAMADHHPESYTSKKVPCRYLTAHASYTGPVTRRTCCRARCRTPHRTQGLDGLGPSWLGTLPPYNCRTFCRAQGLEGLAERCDAGRRDGMSFAKWRSVFRVDASRGLPTAEAVARNARDMAAYAAETQRCVCWWCAAMCIARDLAAYAAGAQWQDWCVGCAVAMGCGVRVGWTRRVG